MPVNSRQQLKYIYAMRKKYKAKANAPESKQWVFNDEWVKGLNPDELLTIKNFKTHSEGD